MPKAVVWDKHVEFGSNPTEYSNEMLNPYMRVGWTKGREHVEVATVNPRGRLYEKASFESEDGKTGGTEWVPIDTVTPGWFVQLDRDGINKLIRELRKARDDAFGRDE